MPALELVLETKRAFIGRARLLFDMQNSSPWCRRNSAPHQPNPAEAQWRWRGERSEPVEEAQRP